MSEWLQEHGLTGTVAGAVMAALVWLLRLSTRVELNEQAIRQMNATAKRIEDGMEKIHLRLDDSLLSRGRK